jgi:hypothetical protein
LEFSLVNVVKFVVLIMVLWCDRTYISRIEMRGNGVILSL